MPITVIYPEQQIFYWWEIFFTTPVQKYTFRLMVNGNRSHGRQQRQEHHKRFDDPTLSTEGIRVALLTVLG